GLEVVRVARREVREVDRVEDGRRERARLGHESPSLPPSGRSLATHCRQGTDATPPCTGARGGLRSTPPKLSECRAPLLHPRPLGRTAILNRFSIGGLWRSVRIQTHTHEARPSWVLARRTRA